MPIIISIQYCKFATSDSAIERKNPRKFQATGFSSRSWFKANRIQREQCQMRQPQGRKPTTGTIKYPYFYL